MKRTITIVLLLFISLTLVACKDDSLNPIYDNVIFSVLGDVTMSIELGEEYIDDGVLAKDGNKDISEFVVTKNDVNENSSGAYIVTYTLDYNGKVTELVRIVNVLFDNPDCNDVEGTNLQVCSKVWTSYLHTVVSLKLYIEKDVSVDTEYVIDVVESILSEFNILSDKYKLYPGVANIKAINDNPTETHVIDEVLFDLIEFSLENQSEVNNIFNIALGPVIDVWHDYREDCNSQIICTIPTIDELEAQNVYTDQSKIIMNRDNLTITMDANMSIDLGGVSKGYISGLIEDYLASHEIYGFILNNGESNISIGGSHPTREGGDFLIAITDPYQCLTILRNGILRRWRAISDKWRLPTILCCWW